MAEYFDDFRDATVGVVPAEYQTVWGGISLDIISGNPLSATDKSIEVTAAQAGYTRTAFKLATPVTEGRTTVRILATHISSNTTNEKQIVGPLLSGSGTTSTRTGYVVWGEPGFRLSKYNSGSDSTLASTSGLTGIPITEYIEIIRDGGLFEVRFWLSGDTRPAAPQISYTDASPLAVSGFVGVSVLFGSLSAPTVSIHSIAVGTNGDPAPTGPVAPGGDEITLTLAPIQQHTQAEAVAAAQVSAVDAVILSQSANSEIASVSQIAMASGVESQQISQSQQASLALSALLGSVEAQQLASAEALDVSIVQPDALTVAVVEQLLQAEPVSASQSALLEAVTGQSRTQALAVQVAADYTLMAVTAEQLAQVEALEVLDGTGLQVVTLEQSTNSDTASVTLLALVDGTAVEQGTNANLVVTAATLVITASQAEQLTEAEIADIVGSAMFLDPRELTVSRTTTGFTVRRTTPTYTMQFKHSVH
jgi:hypothetical protein